MSEQNTKQQPISEREARIQRRNTIIERKVERAKQIDSQVIETKSEDVALLVNLAQQTDIAIIRLRKHIGGRVDIESAMTVISRFEDIIFELESLTKDAMALTGSRYIQPKGMSAMEKRKKANTKEGIK